MNNTLEIPKYTYDKYFRFIGVERAEIATIHFDNTTYRLLNPTIVVIKDNQFNNDVISIIKHGECDFDVFSKLLQYEFLSAEIDLYKVKIFKYKDLIERTKCIYPNSDISSVCNQMIRKLNKQMELKEIKRNSIVENKEISNIE